MEELEITIYGRVQGVNLRWMTKQFCDKIGLKGYVMNKENGDAFIVGQGQKVLLIKLLKWIQSNPGLSKIEGAEYKWKKPSITYNEFSISRKNNYLSDKISSLANLGKSIIKEEKINVPNHIAIIPDGNRRWAKEKGLGASLGHYKAGSYNNLEDLFIEAKNLGVKYMTLWGFSTENWKRDKKEVDAIFSVISSQIDIFERDAQKNRIRFRHLGRKDRLPKNLLLKIKNLEQKTKEFSDFNVQLCLDYGGKDEIIRAISHIFRNGKKRITEEELSNNLDSFGIPDVDLIIRTSGEKRLSGFMPLQSGYAELYFSDVYFPDFDAKELKKAIIEFSNRQRRFGGS